MPHCPTPVSVSPPVFKAPVRTWPPCCPRRASASLYRHPSRQHAHWLIAQSRLDPVLPPTPLPRTRTPATARQLLTHRVHAVTRARTLSPLLLGPHVSPQPNRHTQAPHQSATGLPQHRHSSNDRAVIPTVRTIQCELRGAGRRGCRRGNRPELDRPSQVASI